MLMFVCLFDLILYVHSTIYMLMSSTECMKHVVIVAVVVVVFVVVVVVECPLSYAKVILNLSYS